MTKAKKKRGHRALWDVSAGTGGNVAFRNVLGEGQLGRRQERPCWGQDGYNFHLAEEFLKYLNSRDMAPRFHIGGRNHGKNKFARHAGPR